MALPTLSKTWQFDVNNAAAAGASALITCRNYLFEIKNALSGSATLPWIIASSCDGQGGAGSFGNNDNIDRIHLADASHIVWAAAGSKHTWIVFKQTGLDNNASFCFDCNNATAANATITFSPAAGFDGGTATAAPTATDGITICNSTWGGPAAATAGKISVLQSTDGECTRVLICRSSYAVGYWFFDKIKNPTEGMSTYPLIVSTQGLSTNTANVSTVANLSDIAKATYVSGYIDDTSVLYALTGEGYASALLNETMAFADEDTSSWPMLEIGVYSNTAPHRGRKGEMYDMWWGSTANATGTDYPEDATCQFVQAGHIILPWLGDGTALSTS